MTGNWNTLIALQPMLECIPVELRQAARLRPFARGETLFRQDERPRSMLYVLEGEVRLLRRTPGGHEMILQRSRGGFIAEASLDATTYHCDIVSASDGRLLTFPRTAFRTALETDAAFNRGWIRLLAVEVRHQRARSERLSLNSAPERIIHYLETEGVDGVVTMSQTRKSWAAELGLSHEAMYRTLRQLRDNRTIIIDGQQITLKRRA
jgi:CRP-like cAMP-binding protein